MKTYFLMLMTTIIGLSACDKDTNTDLQDRDKEKLTEMRKEIQDMVDSVNCTDASEWSFSAIGSKPCGGPIGYIAYPHSIDTALFNDMVDTYTKAEKDYNTTYNIISDCRAISPPKAVECVDGKPNLVYNGGDL